MAQGGNTYFISDLHLGASYIGDRIERERKIVELLERMGEDAESLYLVGDILDYWFEYKTVAPRGYVRFLGVLAKLADQGVKITWLIGNHDIWMFDYLSKELGIEVVDGNMIREINGKKFFISHGDGLGRQKASFRFIRWLFRNRTAQKLYSAIHPRWTVGFAYWWSAKNRDYDAKRVPLYDGEIRENVEAWAKAYVADHPDVDYIVMGHHHVMVEEAIDEKTKLIILGDWIYNFSYGIFDGKNFVLKQFESK